MIILFAESEYKIQKHAKHGITVICFLSFDFITSRAKIPSFKSFFGQHNEMIWRSTRTFKIQKQNKREIPNNRLCSTETLHHFLWTFLSSFLRFTLIAMFGFYDKLSSHSLSLCLRTHSISKNKQSPCEEFCGIVTWLGNVFAFFALLFLVKKKEFQAPKPKK